MKAVQLTAPKAAAFEIIDAEQPRPGHGEVLIRVLAAAICGTDRHIYDWAESIRDMITPPLIPGHEFCGEVAELGPGVPPTLVVGDYVSAEMHLVCGVCLQCHTGNGHVCSETRIVGIHCDGAFAEYVKVPASNVIKLDRERIPLKIGAFLDALGNAVHTVFKVPVSGKRVAVLGYGSIGAMTAAVAHFCGAAAIYITDVNEYALDRANSWIGQIKQAGRHAGLPVRALSVAGEQRESSLAQIQQDGGVDVALELSGAPSAINDAMKITRNGGDVVLLGLPRSNDVTLTNYKGDLIFRGLSLHGVIGRKMYETWHQMLALLEAGLDVSHVVSLQIPLVDFKSGMETFSAGQCQKVVLYPNGVPDQEVN
jgi:threonine 3-dehydrogenase